MKLLSHTLSNVRQAAARRLSASLGPSAAALALLSATGAARAALPPSVQPGNGVAAGDYIALLQQYWKSGIAVLVLIVGTYACVQVAGGAIEKFGEWHRGKCDITDLKWYFLLGVVMLVAVIYLLNTAAGIL